MITKHKKEAALACLRLCEIYFSTQNYSGMKKHALYMDQLSNVKSLSSVKEMLHHIELDPRTTHSFFLLLKEAVYKQLFEHEDGAATTLLFASVASLVGVEAVEKGFDPHTVVESIDNLFSTMIEDLEKTAFSTKGAELTLLVSEKFSSIINNIYQHSCYYNRLNFVPAWGQSKPFITTSEGYALPLKYDSKVFDEHEKVVINGPCDVYITEMVTEESFQRLLEKYPPDSPRTCVVVSDVVNETKHDKTLERWTAHCSKHKLPIFILDSSSMGSKRDAYINDLCVFLNIHKAPMQIEELGVKTIKQVVLTPNEIIFVDGLLRGDQERVNNIAKRISFIHSEKENQNNVYQEKRLEDRLVRLSGQIITVHVPGNKREVKEYSRDLEKALRVYSSCRQTGWTDSPFTKTNLSHWIPKDLAEPEYQDRMSLYLPVFLGNRMWRILKDTLKIEDDNIFHVDIPNNATAISKEALISSLENARHVSKTIVSIGEVVHGK